MTRSHCEATARYWKVDVDSKDSNDRTPLSWASKNGVEVIVKLLLDAGKVDVDSKDSIGRIPLLVVAEKGSEVIENLAARK